MEVYGVPTCIHAHIHPQQKNQNSSSLLLPQQWQCSHLLDVPLHLAAALRYRNLHSCSLCGMRAACVGTSLGHSHPKEWLSLNKNDRRGFLFSHLRNAFFLTVGVEAFSSPLPVTVTGLDTADQTRTWTWRGQVGRGFGETLVLLEMSSLRKRETAAGTQTSIWLLFCPYPQRCT